ncbi:hypothetical protein [Desulfovibrio sp. ZJ369]|uniref:hypothetical protein n=1 Tax=Desulfovibrio sp. ZJ369 TaxID=2709793 RepID=UPI0013EB422A|nr:hypothetical protein [Desulfovibrio sp. ZJ369]
MYKNDKKTYQFMGKYANFTETGGAASLLQAPETAKAARKRLWKNIPELLQPLPERIPCGGRAPRMLCPGAFSL